jgi:hemolysin III
VDRPKSEEFINGWTHAAGTVLSIAGALLLCQRAARLNDGPVAAACIVFGFSLVAVYFSSAMSHWERDPARKMIFRRLDQAFIYVLIVASFTTFSVAFLTGIYQTVLLGTMWLIAISGFVSKLWLGHRLQSVVIWAYLGLGWMAALSLVPWLLGIRTGSAPPAGCMWLIVVGGIFYSAGTYFLFYDKKHWYYHAIWHVFVMLGSSVHFLAVWIYVVGFSTTPRLQ